MSKSSALPIAATCALDCCGEWLPGSTRVHTRDPCVALVTKRLVTVKEQEVTAWSTSNGRTNAQQALAKYRQQRDCYFNDISSFSY